jgi:hypothetical protein
MWSDPILEEIYAVREELAKELNSNVDALFRLLREREQSRDTKAVTLPPQRPASNQGKVR